jgi:hypothetical protein
LPVIASWILPREPLRAPSRTYGRGADRIPAAWELSDCEKPKSTDSMTPFFPGPVLVL